MALWTDRDRYFAFVFEDKMRVRTGIVIVLLFAGDRSAFTASSEWSRVKRLQPCRVIAFRTNEAPFRKTSVVGADEQSLVVVKPALPSAPGVETFLKTSVSMDGKAVLAAALGIRSFTTVEFSLDRNGLSIRNQRVAALEDLLEIIPRQSVVEVVEQRYPERKGAMIGAAVGVGMGVLSLMEYCTSCSGAVGRRLMVSVAMSSYIGALIGKGKEHWRQVYSDLSSQKLTTDMNLDGLPSEFTCAPWVPASP